MTSITDEEIIEAFNASVEEYKQRKALDDKREYLKEAIKNNHAEGERLKQELHRLNQPDMIVAPLLQGLISLVKREAGYVDNW